MTFVTITSARDRGPKRKIEGIVNAVSPKRAPHPRFIVGRRACLDRDGRTSDLFRNAVRGHGKRRLIEIFAIALLVAALPNAHAQQAPPPAVLTKQSDILTMFAKNGDIEAVDTMVRRGADIAVVDSNGNSPLVEALENSHFALALDLIAHGAADRTAADLDAAMQLAITRGNVDVVQALLDHGVGSDKGQLPAVENAAGIGNLELVKLLVDHGASVDRRDDAGGNAVLAAVRAGGIDVLRYLLDHGGDPNVFEKAGETPLTEAVKRGRTEMIPLLLAHGADVRRANAGGDTALDLVDDGRHPITYPRLHAAWMKYPAAERHKIGAGPHNAKTSRVSDPNEALFLAADSGDAEAARVLLARGVNPSLRDIDDHTVLLLAIRARSAQVVTELIDHGASVDESETFNNTPLAWSCIWDEIDIAKLLIDRGANVDPGDAPDQPIIAAAEAGDADLVRLLLSHGANVAGIDGSARTALWYAADLDDPSIAAALLSHGADPNIPDAIDGDTPLIRAARHGRRAIVSLLLSHGADPARHNLSGQSALDVAGDGYHPATLAVLHAGPGIESASLPSRGPFDGAANHG